MLSWKGALLLDCKRISEVAIAAGITPPFLIENNLRETYNSSSKDCQDTEQILTLLEISFLQHPLTLQNKPIYN